MDEDPPLDQLLRILGEKKEEVEKGESVVYWMRMEDIRSEFSTTSAFAVVSTLINSRGQHGIVHGFAKGKKARCSIDHSGGLVPR